MDKELADCNETQKDFRTELDVLEDRMMDVEMSAQGAHRMIADVKEEVRDFSDSFGNLHNQVESMRVEDIAWCRSRISVLEKSTNPANKSLWTLVNLLVRRVDAQADLIKDLRSDLEAGKERVSMLEMSSSMIRSRVLVLEEAMEIDPPVTDLSGDEGSTDSEYADVDDGGAMLVDDSEDERDQENEVPIPIPPPATRLDTPRPPTVLRELIPIEAPAPVPTVEVDEGEDDAWYIPPIHRRRIHPLSEFTTAPVDPVPTYVEDRREDPLAGPSREDLAVDGSEDEMWANLGVNRRDTPAE
jgi:predicted RNase H-like nuclease (RuvC/YqgF family)